MTDKVAGPEGPALSEGLGPLGACPFCGNAGVYRHTNELRQAVQALAAANAWHHFGDCRAWTAGPILSPLEADELARRVLWA